MVVLGGSIQGRWQNCGMLVSVLGCRCKEFLSKHVHLMCYRICVRALTAIITYHHR